VLIAASNEPSGNGNASAVASTAGILASRCARIAADGSTAVTVRSFGS